MKNAFKKNYVAMVVALSAGLFWLFCGLNAWAVPVAVVKSLDGSHILCKELYAGQTIEVGTVCLEVVGDTLNVTYKISDTAAAEGWRIKQTAFWTGTRIEDMPQNKAGNAVIGKFPYKSPLFTCPPGFQTSYVQTISLLNLSFACPTDKDVNYYAAAHADVVKVSGCTISQIETAWGDGDRIAKQGNWGMYFTYTLSCSNNEAERRCETAFATSSTLSQCFLDLDLDDNGVKEFKRWGWTNGPLEEGSYSFDIYAAAGRCILSNGELVGTLSVEYSSDGMASVTYDISPEAAAAGWEIDQVHIYVGSEILPRDVNGDYTVAPGQYTIIKDHVDDLLSDTSKLGPFSGPVYVVAHATVCTWEYAGTILP